MLEKNRVAFDELVADVMQEIKSLKNLLARGRTKESAVIGVSGVGKASIPAWQLESASTAPPDVQSEEISAAETQVSQPTETPNDNTAQKLTGVEAEDSKFDKDDSDLYKESESKKKSKHRARSKSPFKAQK